MSTIDARIPLGVQPPQVKPFEFGDTMVQIARLKAYQQQQRLDELRLGQAEREQAQKDEWTTLWGQAFQPSTPAARGAGGAQQGLTAQAPQQTAWPAPTESPQGPPGLTGPLPAVTPGSPYETIPTSPEGRGLTATGEPPLANVGMRTGEAGLGAVSPDMAARLTPTVTPPQGERGLATGGEGATFRKLPQIVPELNQEILWKAYAKDPERTAKGLDTYFKLKTTQLDQVEKNSDLLYQTLSAVEKNPDPATAWPLAIKSMRDKGLKLPDDLPEAYDPVLVRYYRDEARGLKQQVEENKAALYQQQTQTSRLSELEHQRNLNTPKPVNYGLGNDRDAAVHRLFGDTLKAQNRGPTQQEVAQADDFLLNQKEASHLRNFVGEMPYKEKLAKITGEAAENAKPLDGTQQATMSTMLQSEQMVKRLMTDFTPEERKRFVGAGGLRMGAEQAKQLLADATGGKGDKRFAEFVALVNLGKAEVVSFGGKALTEPEKALYFGFIPTGEEWSAEQFEEKLKLSHDRIPTDINRRIELATTPRSELAKKRQAGGTLSETPATGAQGKPVEQMSRDEIQAEILRLRQKG